eukprot:TRINITY_DN2234_c1_g1_i1.p1 TRINITY_DN2234_c1_g1~~TRINITY_DN2234_c1_g1_i1.p1  ORF type:complete len:659 (+),score=135.21 TRINITY_DN2234_c1_g1_i1:71-2047(+)
MLSRFKKSKSPAFHSEHKFSRLSSSESKGKTCVSCRQLAKTILKCKSCPTVLVCSDCAESNQDSCMLAVSDHPSGVRFITGKSDWHCADCKKFGTRNNIRYSSCNSSDYNLCISCLDKNYQPTTLSNHPHSLHRKISKTSEKCEQCSKQSNNRFVCKECEIAICEECVENDKSCVDSTAAMNGGLRTKWHCHSLHTSKEMRFVCNNCLRVCTEGGRYRCPSCDFDLCSDCTLSATDGDKTISHTIRNYPHPMSLKPQEGSWKCLKCSKSFQAIISAYVSHKDSGRKMCGGCMMGSLLGRISPLHPHRLRKTTSPSSSCKCSCCLNPMGKSDVFRCDTCDDKVIFCGSCAGIMKNIGVPLMTPSHLHPLGLVSNRPESGHHLNWECDQCSTLFKPTLETVPLRYRCVSSDCNFDLCSKCIQCPRNVDHFNASAPSPVKSSGYIPVPMGLDRPGSVSASQNIIPSNSNSTNPSATAPTAPPMMMAANYPIETPRIRELPSKSPKKASEKVESEKVEEESRSNDLLPELKTPDFLDSNVPQTGIQRSFHWHKIIPRSSNFYRGSTPELDHKICAGCINKVACPFECPTCSLTRFCLDCVKHDTTPLLNCKLRGEEKQVRLCSSDPSTFVCTICSGLCDGGVSYIGVGMEVCEACVKAGICK